MSEGDIFGVLLSGSIRDPIGWIFGVILGWSTERPLAQTVSLMVGGGVFWGAIRAGAYGSLGETLTLSLIASIMVVCIGLMVSIGLIVREIRSFLQPK